MNYVFIMKEANDRFPHDSQTDAILDKTSQVWNVFAVLLGELCIWILKVRKDNADSRDLIYLSDNYLADTMSR